MKGVPGTENIRLSASKTRYELIKCVDYKNIYFGSGRTLIEALVKRDYLEANNWTKKQYQPNATGEKYIYEKGSHFIIIKNGSSFGTFNTLNEAIYERDLLIEFAWDIEKICECVDESTNGEKWLDGVKRKSSFQKRIRNDYFLAKRGGIL